MKYPTLKKAMVLMAAVFSLTAAAQEPTARTRNWSIELGFGTMTFLDHPSLSLFADDAPLYAGRYMAVEASYRLSGGLLGLGWSVGGVSTSHLNTGETAMLSNLYLFAKTPVQVAEHLELYLAGAFGATRLTNSYTLAGNDYKEGRWIIDPRIGVGATFDLGNGLYSGVEVSMAFLSVGHDYDLPAGAPAKNSRDKADHADMKIVLGYRF